MNKRLVAALLAGLLALVGVVVLVAWAKNANERAYEGADLVKVVRVTSAVPEGTKAGELSGSTEIASLPSDAVPQGAVRELGDVAGLSTSTSLKPGEVLLESRMSTPGASGKGGADVPKGYQEISIALEAERVVGGTVKEGDHVGVLGTYETKDGRTFASWTRHNVIVTKVAGDASLEKGAIVMVTLAVKTLDAEKIAFTKDFGKVWLTKENSDTETSGERLITPKDVLK